MTISVLMTTYAGDDPDQLTVALESMFNQSVSPDQLVLIVDGPVSPALNDVICQYEYDPRIPKVSVHHLSRNGGLANALNAGLTKCTGEWIMRMDSDDISMPDRVAVQKERTTRTPDVDVIGCWCEEFFDDVSGRRQRKAPVTHEAITQALRWRCVLTHPTIVIRASMLRSIDGYRTKYGLLEDYDLYVRLALAGAIFWVIPKVLVWIRVSPAQIRRRGGLAFCLNDLRFRTFCWRSGFLSLGQYVGSTLAYLLFRAVGGTLRSRLYRLVRTDIVAGE